MSLFETTMEHPGLVFWSECGGQKGGRLATLKESARAGSHLKQEHAAASPNLHSRHRAASVSRLEPLGNCRFFQILVRIAAN